MTATAVANGCHRQRQHRTMPAHSSANLGYARPESGRSAVRPCHRHSSAAHRPRWKAGTRFRNPICARICARDAAGRVETREMQQTRHERPPSVRRGHSGDQRQGETAETHVVWLITQRSEVQILPPLPRPEALSRTEKGPSACGVLTDLLLDLASGRLAQLATVRLGGDCRRGELPAND